MVDAVFGIERMRKARDQSRAFFVSLERSSGAAIWDARMGLNTDTAARLRKLAADESLSDTALLNRSLMLSVKWITQLWVNTLVNESVAIRAGVFEGMKYVVNAAEGALLPRLVGTYERELAPHLRAFAEEGLDHVVDIGCAEGYYAVGLARLMPMTTINAFDIDETARRRCGILARANDVADRVLIGEAFHGEDFERFRGSKVLVFIDAEGFEDDILRPDLYPALTGFNLIVETHPLMRPGVTERLIERFSPTHDIVQIDQGIEKADMPDVLAKSSHLEMVLATWEWRARPTPWLVMRPKSHAPGV